MIIFNNSFPFSEFATYQIDDELQISIYTLTFNALNDAQDVEDVEFIEFLNTATSSVLITL